MIRHATRICIAALAAATPPAPLPAQPPAESYKVAHPNSQESNLWPEQTFYLKNVDQIETGNDLVTAIRNTADPHDRVYYVADQNAIVTRANPDDIPLIEKIIADVDRPKKMYRTTYTVTDTDNGKRLSTQHFVLTAYSGQKTQLKEGSRIPIATGDYKAAGSAPSAGQTQVTYLDVGMNFEETLTDTGSNGILKYGIERSNLAPEVSGVGPQDPIVRETSLVGEASLSPGKPLMLGSLDIPGSTGHIDVEVVMEEIR